MTTSTTPTITTKKSECSDGNDVERAMRMQQVLCYFVMQVVCISLNVHYFENVLAQSLKKYAEGDRIS